MNKENQIKVVIICNNINRDFAYQSYLKKEIERNLKYEVTIIGSIADRQRIFYLLFKICPDIVILPQVQEESCREIASYVRKSGGLVCIIPAEITYSSKLNTSILNKQLEYLNFFDYMFLPGKKMCKDLISYGFPKSRLFITGSPKIDILVGEWKKFKSRKTICHRYNMPLKKKNICIFSTFIITPEEYIRKEEAYTGLVDSTVRLSKSILLLREKYSEAINKMCIDFPDYNIVLKPHPLEDGDWFATIKSPNFYIIRNESANNMMKSIDLLLHWNSTVATEGWVHGIKTIQYVPIKEHSKLLCDFHRGNPICYSYGELHRQITSLIDKPLDKRYIRFQSRYLKEWYGRLDGKSGERVVTLLTNTYLVKGNNVVVYGRNFSMLYYIFIFLENVFGSLYSRRIVSLFIKYQWQYAVDNLVYIPPKTDR